MFWPRRLWRADQHVLLHIATLELSGSPPMWRRRRPRGKVVSEGKALSCPCIVDGAIDGGCELLKCLGIAEGCESGGC